MASTLSDQALALAMGTASVFLFDRGHPHKGAHMALASVDRDESPQQGERIDPIGLHSAGPAIDLDACRIEDAAVDPDLGQRTRQPETVVTRFITDHNPLLLPRSLAQSADQISQIATGDPSNARPIAIRTSDGNDPALLAELDRRINRRLEPDTIVHACHCCRSPVVDAAILTKAEDQSAALIGSFWNESSATKPSGTAHDGRAREPRAGNIPAMPVAGGVALVSLPQAG